MAISGFRRFLADVSGAAAVEFALVLPMYLLMVLLLLEIGNYFWLRHTVDHVARETAREGITRTPWGIKWDGSEGAAEDYLKQYALDMLKTDSLKTERATASVDMNITDRIETVTVTYLYKPVVVPKALLPETTLTATATMDLQKP
ncbi:MAG: hypothetical protein GC201_16105 [Alphaproteobacteria bacterium]|nr:hypothetical protein [Alphaproteobacteria bacterium]